MRLGSLLNYTELFSRLHLISIPLPDRPVTVVHSALGREANADANLVRGPTALVAAAELNLLYW